MVINPAFYESINSRELLMGFFLTVVLEGLEAKYNVTLDRRKNVSHLHVNVACFVGFEVSRLVSIFVPPPLLEGGILYSCFSIRE